MYILLIMIIITVITHFPIVVSYIINSERGGRLAIQQGDAGLESAARGDRDPRDRLAAGGGRNEAASPEYKFQKLVSNSLAMNRLQVCYICWSKRKPC